MRVFRALFIPGVALMCAALLGAWRPGPPPGPADAGAPPAVRAVSMAPPALDAEVAAPRTPALLRTAASIAPVDVSTLIVADDLASIRKTEACDGLLGIIETLDLFPASRQAWAQLAGQLRITPEEAFDELLGGHVVFLTRREPDGGTSWALVSRVTLAAAKRLGGALGATPRSELAGLPVFALENGAFILHIRSERKGGTAWITIGPGQRPELVRRMVDPPKGVPELVDDPAFLDLISALPEAADAFVYRRLDAEDPVATPDFVVGAVRVKDGSLVATYAARTALQDRPDSGWSRAAFDALNERSLATVAESGAPVPGRVFGNAMGALNPLRQLFDPFGRPDLLGERGAFTIRRTGGGLGIAIASESSDIGSLAPLADRYMAEQLAKLFPKKINAERRLDITGLAPEALRVIPMQGTPLAALLGDREATACAWAFVAGPEGQAEDAGPTPGWWVSGVDAETIARSARALEAGGGADGEWSALASIHPNDLSRRIAERTALPVADPVLRAMRRIERLTLSERWLAPGKVVGSVSAEFLPEGGGPGAPQAE